jgi:D-alanine-D-alanine ligase
LKKKKTKVALIFGGRSAEHEISIISASAIFKNIDKRKHGVVSIYITKQGDWKKVSSPLLPAAKLASSGLAFSFLPWEMSQLRRCVRADIYFPVLHGPYGEDGTIQGLLEMADVPYVGAGVLASAAGMDKAVMKSLFTTAGVPVVKHRAFVDTEWTKHRKSVLSLLRKEFSLPFFVKPTNLGSSVGISKVKAWAEAAPALWRAFRYNRKILVEAEVSGREIECSVLGNDCPRASLPGEVIPFREFYDYRDKYLEGKTQFHIPAPLPANKAKEVQRLAVAAYKAVGCSGMARIDFFLEERTGQIYVNEINTIPGFTKISMYPKLWEASGIPFARLVEELIRLGFERHRKKKRCLERLPR